MRASIPGRSHGARLLLLPLLLPLPLLLLCTALLSVACSPESASPEGAVKLLLRAAATRDQTKVYELLGPETRRRLQAWVDRATYQTGGRRRFKPEDLLAPALDQPRQRVSRYETLSVRGDRARVKVVDTQDHKSEIFELVRVGGGWRIELPATAFAPPPPAVAPKPSTRPASRPASVPVSPPATGPVPPASGPVPPASGPVPKTPLPKTPVTPAAAASAPTSAPATR